MFVSSEGTERRLSLLWKKEESSHPVQEFPVQLMSTLHSFLSGSHIKGKRSHGFLEVSHLPNVTPV